MKLKTKKDIKRLIANNSNTITNYGIKRIGLFGSWVLGQQKQNSDVDLLIEFNKDQKTYKNFIAFSDFIEKLFEKKVDLLTPESLSPHIAPYIKKEVEYVQIT